MNGILCAALLLAAGPAAAAGPVSGPDDHHAPAENLAQSSARDQRQQTLQDMWQRGILGTDMDQWSPEDQALLQRMRQAEALGALGLLRRHFLSTNGLVLRDRPAGENATRLRLTRLGYEKYITIKSQEALQYFESKEIATKWAYWLTDLTGRPLFDRGSGLLTQAGEELYSQALANRPTFWKLRTGEVRGNRPVPLELRPKPAPAPPAPPPAPRPAAPPASAPAANAQTAVSTEPVVFTAPARAPAKAQ
jgi:hypothetical protein